MKKVIILLVLATFAHISNAQQQGTGLKKLSLKGHVKQITCLIYEKVGPVGTTTFDTLSRPERRVIEFDTSGNITRETDYSDNGSVKDKVVYNYPNDKTVVINYFDPWDNPVSQSIDRYDKNGFEVEYIHRTAKGVSNRLVFKNDKDGRLIELDNYVKNDSLSFKTVNNYTDNGQKIGESLFDEHGKQFQKTVITNDLSNRPIHKEIFDMNGKIGFTWNCTESLIDQSGNWQVEQIETFYQPQHGGEMTAKILTKRKIEYY